MNTYSSGDVLEVKSRVNTTFGGILRISLCVRLDSSLSEDEECQQDFPLLPLNSHDYDIVIDKSQEVSTVLLLPEAVACEHCVLRWRFTEGKFMSMWIQNFSK